MEMKTDQQLKEIINDNPDSLHGEALMAANDEIEKRKEHQSFDIEPEFPEKPVSPDKKQSTGKSLASIVLFIAAFYFIFDWEINHIIILTMVLFIHELGHFFAMRLYNYKDLSIFFIPLIGAYASGQKEEITQKQKTIISLAGPLPGVLIGSCLLGGGMVTKDNFLLETGGIFVFINLFNLLPVLPLDGGQVIKSLFFESNEKINIVFIWISIVALTIIALKLESYILLIVPVFLLSQIKHQTQVKYFKEYLKNEGFNIDKNFNGLANNEYWLIRDEIAVNVNGFSSIIEPKRYIAVPAENRVINMMKQVVQKSPIKDLGKGGKTLFLLIWIFTFLVPVLTIAVLYLNGLIE